MEIALALHALHHCLHLAPVAGFEPIRGHTTGNLDRFSACVRTAAPYARGGPWRSWGRMIE
jgi:hypothetical protein